MVILRQLLSLRTTLAAAACHLVTELALSLNQNLDSLFDTLFNNLIKLSSLTKKSIAQLSQSSVAMLIRHCSFHGKTLTILTSNLDAKNVQMRIYAIEHIKLLIETHAQSHKTTIENSGGIEVLDKSLRKSLADANAAVRDTARAVFWLLSDIWPNVAKSTLESLDSNNRKLLEKAAPASDDISKSNSRGTSSDSTAKVATDRPSVRSLISSRRAATQDVATLSVALQPTATISSPRSTRETRKESPLPHVPQSVPFPSGMPGSRPSSTHYKPASPSSVSTSPTSVSTSSDGGRRSSTEVRQRSLSDGSPSSRKTPILRSSPLRTFPASASKLTSKSPSPVVPIRSQKTPVRPYPPREKASPQSIPLAPLPPSPTLLAMTQGTDYSTFEGDTLDIANTVPLPHEVSSDDESIHVPSISPDRTADREHPKQPTELSKAAYDNSDTTNLLDHLMDASMISANGLGAEVEEAVKGRAEQAEQTAHRFLELTEPDENHRTVVQQPSLENGSMPASDREYFPAARNGGNSGHNDNAATPLFRRMQDVRLYDTPDMPRGPRSKSATIEDSWWLTKASS